MNPLNTSFDDMIKRNRINPLPNSDQNQKFSNWLTFGDPESKFERLVVATIDRMLKDSIIIDFLQNLFFT